MCISVPVWTFIVNSLFIIIVVVCLFFYLPVFFSKERGREKIVSMDLSGSGRMARQAVRMCCINITVRNIINCCIS